MEVYNIDNQEIITIEEMCEIQNIGKNTAYKLLKNKDIAAFRIGRHWKISKTAVNDYICTSAKK